MSEPTVSVGMPVYNGASSLAGAIENILGQTFSDIEVIISDNASSDGTEALCRGFAARDPRIRYFRQPVTINPTENFKFVLGRASAPFFMWAADDDLRDSDFIEKLLAAMQKRPDAVLAFGDVIEHLDGTTRPIALDFARAGRSPMQKLHWTATSQLHHLYGLWRTQALRRIDWMDVDWWHDMPLMMAAALIGDFIYVPGVSFHYTYNLHPFLYWERKPGVGGFISSASRLTRRVKDTADLIWSSGTTVGRVAGPWAGLAAAYFATLKIGIRVAHAVRKRMSRRGVGGQRA